MTVWRGPDIDWPRGETLPALMQAWAGDTPDAPALVDAATGETLTAGDLVRHVDRLQRGLAARGFGEGDRLAAVMGNSPAWYAMALAAHVRGGAVSGINPAAPAGELARQLALLDPAMVIAPPDLPPAIRRAHTAPVLVSAEPALEGAPAVPEPTPVADRPAFVPFSSGTSGLPKPVVLTHANVIAGGVACGAGLGVRTGARILAVAPVFHVVGEMLLAMALAYRAALVVVARPEPGAVFEAIVRHRATVLPVVPPILRMLVQHRRNERPDLAHVETIGCGGNALPPGLQEAASERFGCPVIQVFGMTEVSGGGTMDDRASPVSGSVGRVLPLFEMRVVDPATGTPCAPGVAGELQFRGPAVTPGYLGAPEATAELIGADGWLHTGDLGEVDAGGRVWVRGRLKELIKVHAGQVPPAELEMLLLAHPAVADAAVIGRPNAHTGEIPVAYVVWREPADPFAVLEWLNEQVLAYKRVRAIVSIAAIPRNPTGKVLRRDLAALDAQRQAAA